MPHEVDQPAVDLVAQRIERVVAFSTACAVPRLFVMNAFSASASIASAISLMRGSNCCSGTVPEEK